MSLTKNTFGASWLSRLLTRQRPATFIPQYDSIMPFDYPRPDLAVLTERVTLRIDELASRGAFDEAHPDLVDRIVHEEIAGWRAEIKRHRIERQRIYEQLLAQNTETAGTLRVKRNHLQAQLDRARRSHDEVWESLAGLTPVPVPVPAPAPAEPAASTQAVSTVQAEGDAAPEPRTGPQAVAA